MQSSMTKRQEMEKDIISKFSKSIHPSKINSLVNKYTEQMIEAFFQHIQSLHIKKPSAKEIEDIVEEFDFAEDKIAAYIKRQFPGWSEDQIYDKLDQLELILENEYAKQIEAVTENISKECSQIEGEIKQEIQSLQNKIRQKYLKK